jgi:hypothetical protein
VKVKTLITLLLLLVIAVPAYAELQEIPVQKIDLAYFFLDGTIEKVQNRVGKLTLVDTQKDPFFPVAFNIYKGQGLKIQTIVGQNNIFSIETNIEDYNTPDGLQVGDSVEKVKSLYGEYHFSSTRNKNNERVMMWYNRSAIKYMVIIIDIDNNKVKSVAVGYILD